ncbi:MAG: enolase C-terminal domain-like protein [SAR202 cluster bacterium]|jgi:L-rhamnonate dehydratase|nr:enolase C-terminal domain-like protein [SAR202 cluster bacterium]
MKITNVKAIYPRWQNLPPRPGETAKTGVWQSHFWQIVVRVDSDTGATGFGYGGGGIPGTIIVNEHLRELLIGRHVESIDDIREIWDMLYFKSIPYGRKGIPVMALSGIDLALWDLLGKQNNKPVYDLLGGIQKPNVRAYASTRDFERDCEAGFTAMKFSHRWTGQESDYDATIELANRARDIFGANALIMTDCYMSWDSEVTLEMARLLSEYNLYWFEDVLTPDNLDQMASLKPNIKPVLLAGGEHEFTHHGFGALAKAGSLDVWQPDITWCGGITAGLRILEIAHRFGVSVVPHRGGEIWALHLIVASECENLAETHPDRWQTPIDNLWTDEPYPVGGYIAPSDRPGFGVTLNESML